MRSLALMRLALFVVPVLFALVGCKVPECLNDDGCSGGFCVEGQCVDCLASNDCGADQACCQGACVAADVEDICGCAADPRDERPGSACAADEVCVVDGTRAGPGNVADGACGCPCDATQGGSVCATSTEAQSGFVCSCDRSDPVGTCEAPVLDDELRPHRAADTCTPDSACVCFASGAPCLDGDCTAGGCVDLLRDAASCGVAGRSCTDEATGIPDTGACLVGGCTCNAASDCQGAGLNVDSCQFVGDGQVTQCVCGAYRAGGLPAACPMGFECQQGGCAAGGTAHATEEALLEALGVTIPADAGQ